MSNLRAALNALTSSFADSILSAIRSASLDDLVGKDDGAHAVSNGRSARAPAASRKAAKSAPAAAKAAPALSSASTGRLPRRSAEEITKVLDGVVALVKKHKEGLRAEQIRSELALVAKEMPRVLKEGLSSRRLKSKGQKRATTYFAS